jgi:predicted RNA-binding protein with EMAP domain
MLSLRTEPSYRGCEAIKALQKRKDIKNKPKQRETSKRVRVVLKSEPQTAQIYKKTYSQVVFNNVSEAEDTTSMENMLAQIMQMLKDKNLYLNKIESSMKITLKSLMANSLRIMKLIANGIFRH